jgi:RHS repeat-associated protein
MRHILIITLVALSFAASAQTYTVRWVDLVGMTNNNEILTKTAASSWTNSTATSSNFLAPNTDGSIQFTFAGQLNVQIGFISNNFAIADYTKTTNSIFISAAGAITTYEGSLASVYSNYTSGDVFKISRESSQVKYYRNGTVFRTVTVDASLPLWIRADVLANGGTTPAVTASFDAKVLLRPTITGTSTLTDTGNIVLNVDGGRAPYSYSWSSGETTNSITNKSFGSYTVTATDADNRTATATYSIGYKVGFEPLANATELNGSLTRIPGTTGYSGAYGTNRTEGVGWVEFVISDYTSFYEIGIGAGKMQVSITGGVPGAIIAFDGNLGYFGPIFRIGDVMRIERTSTQVIYSRNGVVFRTATVALSGSLVPSVSITSGTAPRITCSVDARVIAAADVKGTSAANGTGSIAVNGYGGVAPYSYSWSGGLGTTPTLTNLSRGTYTVTIADAEGRQFTRSYSVGYKMAFTSITNVSESDGVLSKPVINGAWDAGGVTCNILPAGTDGYVEWVIPQDRSSYFLVGVQYTNVTTPPWALTPAWGYFPSSNYPTLLTYEGTGSFANGRGEPGDVMRIERTGSSLMYKLNGVTIRTTSWSSIDWRVSIAIQAGKAPRVTSSFDATPIIVGTVTGTATPDNTAAISTSVSGGTSPYSYSWSSGETTSSISGKARGTYTITVTDAEGRTASRSYGASYQQSWITMVNAYVDNGWLTRVAGAPGPWLAGGYSSNAVPPSTDGWVEVVTGIDAGYIFGFNQLDATNNPNGFRNGLYVSGNGTLTAYNGTVGTALGAWIPGDVLRIGREGSNTVFRRNGAVIFSVVVDRLAELNSKIVLNTGGRAPAITSSHDVRLYPVATVIGTEKTDGTGAISLKTVGGTGPYTYSWSNGETTSSITGKNRGQYSVTVTDNLGHSISRTYNIGYRQHYLNVANTVDTDNELTTTTPGTWNAAANSSNIFPASTDGWVEFVADSTPSVYSIGFNGKYGTTDYRDVIASFWMQGANKQVSSSELSSGTALSTVMPGDVFRMVRTGSTLAYYRNGILLRTYPFAANQLTLKICVYAGRAPRVVTSFDGTVTVSPTVNGIVSTDNKGNVSLNVVGGTPPYSYSWSPNVATSSVASNLDAGIYSVTVTDQQLRSRSETFTIGYKPSWTGLTNVNAAGQSLSKTSAPGWNAGALTSNPLASNTDGWMEFAISNYTDSYIIGLTNVTNSFLNTSFKYAVFVDPATSTLYTYQDATQLSLSSYQVGDIIRIERIGTSINYKRNGIILRTASTDPSLELRAKAAINTGSAPSIASSFEIGAMTVALNNWGYQYRYDARHRMIAKRLPGADWVYMVYDNRDRLVLTQDGGLRASKQWQFTKYDQLNRPILTGIKTLTTVATQTAMQAEVDQFYNVANPAYGETRGSVVHGYTNNTYPSITDPFQYWTVTYYDDYDWIAGVFNGTRLQFSSTEYANTDYPDNTVVPASSRVNGMVTGTKVKVMDGGPLYLTSASYYDEKGRVIQVVADNYKLNVDRSTNIYDFVGKILKSKTVHTESDVTWKEKLSFTENGRVLGNNSASPGFQYSGAVSTSVLPANTDGWIEAIVNETNPYFKLGFTATNQVDIDYAVGPINGRLYTFRGATQSADFAGGQPPVKGDVMKIQRTGSTIYFYRNNVQFATMTGASTGALMIDAEIYQNGLTIGAVRSSFTTTTHTTARRFDYDHVGRLMRTWHRLDSNPEILLTDNSYNELGQLVEKNLHSADNGATSKQSVDYSYNIRGWMTSINGSDLDPNTDGLHGSDLFGMDLLYNAIVPGVNDNNALYNGNISATKWKVNRGSASVESAYSYGYDPMNRLTSASFREKNSGWAASNKFSESNYQYDLNGNILALSRNGKDGTAIDNLSYSYGIDDERSNKLLKVADTGNKAEGFLDGSNTDNDYQYDANGNMIIDKNKSIVSSISYLYPFNLPVSVTRMVSGGTSNAATIAYIYDATGRKLNQTANYYSSQRGTDYAGDFIYEDDVLQSIQHEEGRIAMAERERIAYNDGSVLAGTTANNATVSIDPTSSHSGQTYLKVAGNGNSTDVGVYLATGIPVVPGETYLMRVKGYLASVTAAPVVRMRLVKPGNQIVDLAWPSAILSASLDGESWVEQTIQIPANVPANTTLSTGLFHGITLITTPLYYINEFELVRISGASPEYQYNLKDHLGNVRVTFGTHMVDSFRATLETDSATVDRANFFRYDLAKRVNSFLFDHTHDNAADSTGYAQRLNGSTNEKVGLAKSFAVMPGDVIKAEVYAKYVDPNSANWAAALTTLMGYITSPGTAPAGTIVDGAGYTSSGTTPLGITPIGHSADTDTGVPKAYLNYIFINKNFDIASVRTLYTRISSVARENGSDVPHEKLSLQDAITEEGYVYVYLSNDGSTTKEVYFDDFKITHEKLPVIQSQDYYPFGLTFNSYQREDGLNNPFQYNGKEMQDEGGLGWLDYGARMYMSDIGRWGVVDPMADARLSLSPYNYVQNNPMIRIDPTGMLDVYGLNSETGDINLIEKNDDKTDQLVDSKTNETVDGSVAKGILQDGMNIQENGLQTSQVNEGVSLVTNISMHTGKEVQGTVYQNENGDKFLNVDAYKNAEVYRNDKGEVTGTGTGVSSEVKKNFTSADGSFSGTAVAAFHTHMGHPDNPSLGTPTPSYSDKMNAETNRTLGGVDVPYYIFARTPITVRGETTNSSVYSVNPKTGSTTWGPNTPWKPKR